MAHKGRHGMPLAAVALGLVVSASLVGVAVAKEDANHLLFDGIAALEDQYTSTSGLWWKARYAAHAAKAACGDKAAADNLSVDESKTVTKDGVTMMAASTDRYDLVLSFCADDNVTFEGVAAGSEDGSDLSATSYLDGLINGTEYSSDAVKTFMKFADSKSKDSVKGMAEAFHGAGKTNIQFGKPVNVLCTGSGMAVAMVPLCATYAAVTFPQAHITAQSFNGTWPASNGKFNWTTAQIVDQQYYWPNDVSGYGDGKVAEMGLNESLDKAGVSEMNVFSDAGEVADELREILNDATTVRVFAKNGTDMTFRVEPEVTGNLTGTYEVVEIKGQNYDQEQLNYTKASYAEVEADPKNCPLVLCKTRFPGYMSGMIYAEYDPNNPEWIGPVPLDYIMENEPYYKRVKGDHDADGAVLYKEDTDTLYFIWRGTESDTDWAIDANILEKDWPVENDAERIWEDPEVSMGFYMQLGALTDLDAGSDEENMQKIAMNFTGGRVPKLIVCTGQSLGGALSTLCGAWMANAYPNATILVVNEGSPKTGDEHWVKYVNHHVGRLWRIVNEADQVPLLAPLDIVQHAGKGMWIHDGKILLDERPPMTLEETQWDDHSYYKYSIIQDELNRVDPPQWAIDDL